MPGGGLITSPCVSRTPLGNKLVLEPLSALTKLGDETIKLAGREGLAASLPGSLNQRKILLVNI